MFYKKDEKTGEWYVGNEVHFPDGEKLTAENRTERDGWKWYEEPPSEYIDSLNEKNQNYEL